MSDCSPIRKEIVRRLSEKLPLNAGCISDLLVRPPRPEMGDYSLPCFEPASVTGMSPPETAAMLEREFDGTAPVERTDAAGPYFNVYVDRAHAASVMLKDVCQKAEHYGKSDLGAGKTVVIDYSSPNIAKHLGVHHLRSAIIGRSLYRIFEALGYKCAGINHLGDWGTSFGKLIAAFERYDDLDAQRATVTDLQDAYVHINKEAQQMPELENEARRAFQRLESGEPKATALWKRFRDISLDEFERIYNMLGIRFDACTPESFYLTMTDECIERMQRSGVAQVSEGALIVPLDQYDMPPCMLRKSDETTLYVTRDICAAEYRWDKYHFERALYVVGNDQKLHFTQLRKVLELMGHEWADRIEHVDFGLIKFRDVATGKALKGSTRRGEMVPLEDVLNEGIEKARQKILDNLDRLEQWADIDKLAAEVGISAVVFSDLSVKRIKDVIFDWDRMLDFEGDTGPYVQYAHARLCSILRKAGEDVNAEADCTPLKLPEEWALVQMVEDFPAKVEAAAESREPSFIANYLLELCSQFSTYYSAGMREPERRVLCEDVRTRSARLLLVSAVRYVIRNGLTLLGVGAPERM